MRDKPSDHANDDSNSSEKIAAAYYHMAVEQYESLGVDVEAALKRLSTIPLSLHCWQGDDVVGFEGSNAAIGGGLAVTGNYPGRART
ncbi:MAG: L-rhamnose isomerase [Pirellulaceae bacterium]